MKRIEELPSAFRRYRDMLGVLDFAVFEDATGSEAEILSAISQTLRHSNGVDTDRLRRLGCRRIDVRTFH